MSDADLTELFLARLAGRTRDNYRLDLTPWASWLAERGTPLLGVRRQDVEEYLVARREQGPRPRTVCTTLSHLRGLYRWAMEEGYVAADPTALVRAPARGRSEERIWLGWADLGRLLDASLDWCGGELAAHVHLWALSGLRPGEPRGLRVEDLSSHDGQATLAVTATKTLGSGWSSPRPRRVCSRPPPGGGGGRRGTLLLNPHTGRPWTKAAERNRLIRLLDAAGLPAVTPYGLRTSFITLALDAGVPEREVMIAARHSSSAQTARYDRLCTHVTTPVGRRLAEEIQARKETR
ncbi:tyrosine-type recombinase/integrase [Actinomyces bowdenii]|uniref:Site-specific integrase n=1 Tax=Actinomyces bowdenii TaxID=131109 RepID=A0A3P1UTB8_9ACTO|nr:site-specific integrase [Actinomyces bowdenii]RRD24446.1 site-specific integrase [Actinomyces bowdenii]